MNVLERFRRWLTGEDARDLILALLKQYGEQYGLDLVNLSKGVLKRGSVYVHLHRLEEAGLVTSRAEDWTPPYSSNVPRMPIIHRRIYNLTEKGRLA